MTSLLILGGAGEMGRWFARRLKGEFEISIFDTDRERAEALAVEEGFGLAEPSEAGGFDAVMLAVPIEAAEAVAREVGPEMSPGSLLLDVTSVKEGPVEAMEHSVGEGVSVLGTHPMFGPTAESLRGQTVILTPTERDDWFRRFRELFETRGAHVEVTTPAEHDEMMSVIQGLTHFVYISFGCALEELKFDVEASRGLMSPVYEVMMDFAGRILNQNPSLYADIQASNPRNRGSREAMMESAGELADLVEEGDLEGFVDRMRSAAEHFGDTGASQAKSDKLIRSLVREREELRDSIGEEVALLNERTGVTHVGELLDYDPRCVRIRKPGGELEMKSSNVRLLGDGERVRWKAENLPLQKRDVSVVTGEAADGARLEEVAELADGVAEAEAIDVYSGEPLDEGEVSVTLRLRILYGENADEVEGAVRREFEGLGMRLR